jgi:hypothetical protein
MSFASLPVADKAMYIGDTIGTSDVSFVNMDSPGKLELAQYITRYSALVRIFVD